MAEVWVLTVVGGGVVSLTVWYLKGELSSVVTDAEVDPEQTPTTDDIAEVREMAEKAIHEATEAQAMAESAQADIRELSNLLVESTSDADNPLLVRIQNRLDSIESELQRQSRVETERAVSMGRIATALEDMDGVDADAVDMEELYDKLPAED